MATENTKSKDSAAVRIYGDKKPRLEKVRRRLAAAEDRDLSEIALIDEILEEGLRKREKKLGLE
jgi:hypothetical protein